MLNHLTSRHLDDGVLAEIWTNASAVRGGIAHPHLDACAECRLRMASLSDWLEGLRADATAEADEAFPAERLSAQQAQITRRLQALTEPTRVLAFPGSRPAAARPSPVRRWIATAAAAGLVIGLGLGQLMQVRDIVTRPSTFPADRVVESARTPQPQTSAAMPLPVGFDPAALDELEEAATPQYETLKAFETFTPRAADVMASAR